MTIDEAIKYHLDIADGQDIRTMIKTVNMTAHGFVKALTAKALLLHLHYSEIKEGKLKDTLIEERFQKIEYYKMLGIWEQEGKE